MMKKITMKIILIIILIFIKSVAFADIKTIDEVKKLLFNDKIYEAELFLIKKVKAKDIQAIRFYAICLIKGSYFNKNLPMAISILKEGAKLKDPLSAYTLGNFYYDGIFLKPNYERANFFYDIALKNGMKKAQNKINEIAPRLILNNEDIKIIQIDNEKSKNITTKQKKVMGVSKKTPSWNEDYLDWDKVRGFGSAFAITSDGKFLTNEHVVKNCKKIFIRYKEKIKIADLIFKVEKQDIAVVDIKASTPSFFGFSKKSIKLGQELISGGFPMPDQIGYGIKITTGIVSSTGQNKIDKKYGRFQHSTPTQSGNSGGALINKSGQVVGMTASVLEKVKNAITPQNVNFAVTGTEMKKQLKKRNITFYLNEDIRKYDTEVLAYRLQQTAAQVICY
jgi:hypothetical protein